MNSSISSFKAVASGVAVIFAFLGAEASFRLYYFGIDSLLAPWNYSPQSIIRSKLLKPAEDPRIGWRLRENARGYLKGAPISTNEYGLRSASVAREKPKGKTRLAVMGRSISMGTGVGDEEVFASRLQMLLDRAYSGKYEVINFSVGGYQVSQVFDSYDRYVKPFDVDAILFPETPGGLVARTRSLPRSLPSRSSLWTNPRKYVQHFFIYRAALVTWLKYMGRTSYFDWSARIRKGTNSNTSWVRTQDLVERFALQRCEDGIPVVVVLLHVGEQDDSAMSEKIKDRTDMLRGIQILDTGEKIDGGYTGGGSIYYGENHPNAAAHARYAQAIFEWLTERDGQALKQATCGEL